MRRTSRRRRIANDFGKFGDTFDIYFGEYSALVCLNNQDNGNYLNENDIFQYTDPAWTSTDFVSGGVNNNITRNVWRYFAELHSVLAHPDRPSRFQQHRRRRRRRHSPRAR